MMRNVERFKAVDSVSAQEHRLRVDDRRQGDELTADAKNRIADVERRFMRSKDKTIAKLNKTKAQIEEWLAPWLWSSRKP